MLTSAEGVLAAPADLAGLREAFETVDFVAVQTPETLALARDLDSEAQELAHGRVRAGRDDADLRYSAGIAALGPKARAFLGGGALAQVLRALTDQGFALTEDMSCLTVYEPGDQLGPHLDQPPERCAVTCILYLACASPDPLAEASGLQLKVYGPERESVQRAPRRIIRTAPGRLVLGRGARVWHERPALLAGEGVTALTACFGAA